MVKDCEVFFGCICCRQVLHVGRKAQELVDFPHYYILQLLIIIVSLRLSPYYLTVTLQAKFQGVVDI